MILNPPEQTAEHGFPAEEIHFPPAKKTLSCRTMLYPAQKCVKNALSGREMRFSRAHCRKPQEIAEGFRARESRHQRTGEKCQFCGLSADFVQFSLILGPVSVGEPNFSFRAFLNQWFAKPMVCMRVAFHANDENDEDNSDSYK